MSNLSRDTNWDDALATNVLEKNQLCLNSFDEAMEQPCLLVPEPQRFDDDYSYLDVWRNLCNLESIQIFVLHRAKKDQEAFDKAFKIIRFGQRVENSGGPILHYLVGSGIKSQGLWNIRKMLADTTLSETDLMSSLSNLNEFGPNKEGFTNALKVEYSIQRNFVNGFADGNIPDQTNSSFERFFISIGIKPLLSARKTKMEFAENDRFLRDNFSKPYAEIAWSSEPGANIITNHSTFRLIVGGNLIGDILFGMTDPISETFAQRKCRENVNVIATQILLALKIYKMEHGELPETLSNLVPEFFPRVPLDDFDGKPFRYLPDKKIIYSVGQKLKDLGGKERVHESEDYNLPFKIEF